MSSYEVLSIPPDGGGDGGVGGSTVTPTVYSHSVGIGMPTAMKTKINNIQTIHLEQLTNTNQKNIAQINDKILNYYHLNPLINDY